MSVACPTFEVWCPDSEDGERRRIRTYAPDAAAREWLEQKECHDAAECSERLTVHVRNETTDEVHSYVVWAEVRREYEAKMLHG